MIAPHDRARFVAQFTLRPTPPVSTFAVAGLILSLLGLSPLGALLCGFALVDIRDGRRRGFPAAVAGLVGGIAGTVVWAYAVLQVVHPGMLR